MPAAARTCVSGANLSEVGEASLEVPAGLHAAQVAVVAVGTDHILALAQGFVGHHLDRRADRPDRATVRAEGVTDLLRLSGPEILAKGSQKLHLVEPVVATDERQHEPLLRD